MVMMMVVRGLGGGGCYVEEVLRYEGGCGDGGQGG